MKRILYILLALMVMFSCTKEEASSVIFTARVDSCLTKGTADGDGTGVHVNRCIMEVYYGDRLFDRYIVKVNDNVATFSAKLVANRIYSVAFWADHVSDADSDEGRSEDLYYTTDGSDGLRCVALRGSYEGNSDERDAFCCSTSLTVTQAWDAHDVTLCRPFSQINVINDASVITAPDAVTVTIRNTYTTFNVLTGEPGGSSDLSYTFSSLYHNPTISMDYVFAPEAESLISIDWESVSPAASFNFSNVPYRQNYRSNINGKFIK